MNKSSFAVMLMAGLVAFASGSASAEEFGADRHIKMGLTCEACHGKDQKVATPEKPQCEQCHDIKKISDQTKNVKPHNPHDSPHYHQDLECTACHIQHAKPDNYCNQCHQFDFKLP